MANCSCSSHGSFLTAKGLKEAAQRHSLEGLAPLGDVAYVDTPLSVSGLSRAEPLHVWDDQLLDQQYRRVHHGI